MKTIDHESVSVRSAGSSFAITLLAALLASVVGDFFDVFFCERPFLSRNVTGEKFVDRQLPLFPIKTPSND
jgi:hypothetical protein